MNRQFWEEKKFSLSRIQFSSCHWKRPKIFKQLKQTLYHMSVYIKEKKNIYLHTWPVDNRKPVYIYRNVMWNDTDTLQISEGKYWNLFKVNIAVVLQECVFIVHHVYKWTPGMIYIHHCLHLLFGRCPQPSLHDGCHWGRIHVFQTLCASILWPEIERNNTNNSLK